MFDSGKLMTRPFHGWRTLAFALLGAAIVLWMLMVATRTPRVELLTRAPGPPNPRLSFLGGWIDPVRSTWRNLRLRLFGPPPNFSISAEIFECSAPFIPPEDSLPAPFATDKMSTRLWLLKTSEWAVVRKSMESNVVAVASPSVWTFEGHPAKIFIGESLAVGRQQPGIAFDVSARARGSRVDLTAFVTRTAAFTNLPALTNGVSIHTNLAVGARVQISSDQRLFLLTSNAVAGKRMAVMVSATIYESKKK